MSKQVNLTYSYTKYEYIAATQLLYERILRTRFKFFVGLIVSSIGLLGLLYFGNSPVGIASIFILMLLIGVGSAMDNFFKHYVEPRRNYETGMTIGNQYFLSFTEECIVSRIKNAESKIEWSFYDEVVESTQFYFLRYGKNTFTLIPKRLFSDNTQEAIFRELLQRKISPHFKTYETSARYAEDSSDYEPPLPSHEPPDWR